MPCFFGVHIIGKLADQFHSAAVLFEFSGEALFKFRSSAGLILDSGLEPRRSNAQAVNPVAGGYQRFDQPFQSEIAEQFLDSGIATVNFPADHFASALTRKVDAALFIKNC